MNVFELVAVLSLNSKKYDDGLKQSETKASRFASKLGGGLATAAKAGAAAVGVASAAVGALVKNSVDGYADYEQLTGGIETLFKKSSDTVMKYAEEAYKTAGMSSNEYMDTVTSFSASLIQSMGGDIEKAAKRANMAIKDMSDNANKMGTSMESIQNAYQGFAKQNYSMLDNLKLGYGGTQQEMFRLMTDAAKLNKTFGETAKFSLDEKGHLTAGYADIVQAIHIVQSEMDITGTTAKEASETISGSISSAKSAWQNLVVGFANGNADIDKLVGDVVTTFGTTFKNLIPAVETALGGIASAFEKLVPLISSKIPSLVEQVLPPLLSAATSLVEGLIEALSTLFSDDNVTNFVEKLTELLTNAVNSFVEILPTVLPTILNGLMTLISGVLQALPGLLQSVITKVVDMIPTLISSLMAALPTIVQGLVNLVLSIVDQIPTIITSLIQALPSVIESVVSAITACLPTLINGAIQLIISLVEHTPEIILAIIEEIPNIILSIINGFVENIDKLILGAVQLVVELVKHTPEIIMGLIQAIPNIVMSIVKGFLKSIGKFVEVGKNLIKGIWKGISDAGKWLWEQISGFFGGIVDRIKNFFGIKSPSKLFKDQIGKNLALGIGEGFLNEMPNVIGEMEDALPETLNGGFDTVYDSVSAIPMRDAAASGGNVINCEFVFNNPQLTTKKDAEDLVEQINVNLGHLFFEREVAYG